jgi:hypothetical protein
VYQDQEPNLVEKRQQLEREVSVLNKFSAFFILAILSPYCFYFSSACMESNYSNYLDLQNYIDKINTPCYYITTAIFGVLFIVFTLISTIMILTLKSSAPAMYQQYAGWMWVGMASLTIPLFARFALDLLWASD